MKAFQTILFLAIIILIGGMAALWWGKSVEEVTASIDVVDELVEDTEDPTVQPVEEPTSGDTSDRLNINESLSIFLVDDLPEHQDSFEFVEDDAGQSVWVEGDMLFVNVGYGGGCQEHEFTMYWNGLWAESAPPQTGVRLIHDANNDFCEAYLSETLQFDLSSITDQYQTFHFNVQGSTKSIPLFVGSPVE